MQNLLVLANKRFSSDFRKYLMRAAVNAGGRAAHIYFGDRLIFSKANGDQCVFARDPHIDTIAHLIRGYLGDSSTVILTGLGCTWSSLAFRLPWHLPNAVPVYDVYDDLLYDSRGMRRIGKWAIDRLWRSSSRQHIVLSKTLQTAYGKALHLDNASHLCPSGMRRSDKGRSMVYIGSVDKRVDFEWLGRIAPYATQIDIWGRVHESFPGAEYMLDALCHKFANITFRGGYDNDGLEAILSHYDIGLIPYKVHHVMTNHINPDKLYHYLNAGLEVIAAPIPSVMAHAKFVHIVSRDGDWSAAIRAAGTMSKQHQWHTDAHSWDRRWNDLRHGLQIGNG